MSNPSRGNRAATSRTIDGRRAEKSGKPARASAVVREPAEQPGTLPCEPPTAHREVARVPVIEESVEVAKRVVESGGVRLRKRVHEDLVGIDESLRSDRFDIERVPMDVEIDGPVAIRQEGDVMIVPVVEERLVVRRFLVEEIRMTRRTIVEADRQKFAVRREEVIVERLDPAAGEWREERFDR